LHTHNNFIVNQSHFIILDYSQNIFDMKKIILLNIFLLIYSFAFAQQAKIDSLRLILKKADTKEQKYDTYIEICREYYYVDIEKYNEIADTLMLLAKDIDESHIAEIQLIKGRYYYQKGEYSQARKIFHNALPIFIKVKDSTQIALLYQNIGVSFLDEGDIDSTKIYLNKMLEINKQINNLKGVFLANYNLGVFESTHSNNPEASKYILKALEVSEQLNNKRYTAYCESMIGVIYLEQELYDKSKPYLERALLSFKNLDDKLQIGNQYVNLGKFYNEKNKDYNKAISHYKKALSYYETIDNKHSECLTIANIGRNYIHLEKVDSAAFYLKKSLDLSKKINSKTEMARSLTNLGEVELKRNKLFLAKKYIDEAIQIAIENDFTDEYAEALSLQAEVYKASGDYKNAYTSLLESTDIFDSLQSVDRVESVANIETKYQTEKKEKENLQLKAEKAQQAVALEKESKRKWFFALGLLFAIISLGIFAFYYQKNKKQKALIESLQKDLHHRVKNNLAVIDSLIEDIKDEFDEPIFATKLTDLQNRIDSINEVHRQLYQGDDLTNLNMKKYVEKLAKNIQESFAKENVSIQNEIKDHFEIPVEKSFPIGLIINEFITNSLKYAFDENEKGEVKVRLTENPKTYLLSLSDNGKGLPKGFDISKLKSFGMDVMQLLSKQLNGTFSLNGDNGVSIKIEFPKM